MDEVRHRVVNAPPGHTVGACHCDAVSEDSSSTSRARSIGNSGRTSRAEFVTLDGVAQAPGEPDEDRDDGFRHGGWQAPLLDQPSGDAMFEQARSND